jgi:GNAT superfamily N-acetyltransferase
MSITVVPRGAIATIVTCLEMRQRPAAAAPSRSALKLQRWAAPVDCSAYCALFQRIGAPWLWRGRLVLDESELAATLNAATTQVHVAARRDGTPMGLIELDFAQPTTCEISYFGLVPEMTGRGHGRWLMDHALKLAWREGIARVWLHTCDLDHPAALDFYQRAGFVPFERWVEIYPDPRVDGTYADNPAPRVPII